MCIRDRFTYLLAAATSSHLLVALSCWLKWSLRVQHTWAVSQPSLKPPAAASSRPACWYSYVSTSVGGLLCAALCCQVCLVYPTSQKTHKTMESVNENVTLCHSHLFLDLSLTGPSMRDDWSRDSAVSFLRCGFLMWRLEFDCCVIFGVRSGIRTHAQILVLAWKRNRRDFPENTVYAQMKQ